MRVVKYTTHINLDTGRSELFRESSVNYRFCNGFDSVEDIVFFCKNFLNMSVLADERLYIFALNNRLKLIGIFEAARGGSTELNFYTRDVLCKVLLTGAKCFVMAHNHPSGDPVPSEEDREMTKTLWKAGNLVGVRLVDSLVIGRPSYVSMYEDGYFEALNAEP